MPRSLSVNWAWTTAILAVISTCFVACIDSDNLSDAKCLASCNGVCVDTQRDPLNCGVCGTACGPGQTCTAGVCGGTCGDTSADPNNCGACGNVCPARSQCTAGACVCPAPTPNACGAGPSAACTDVATDASNCGTCGTVCAAPLACVGGACVTSSSSQGSLVLLAGQLGSSGNLDGTGVAARFNGPWGICRNGDDLLVADTNNCVIRKVASATGVTTTFAGVMGSCALVDGIGAAARLNAPTGCTLDGAGNLFVTERGSCVIRKIELATATVTTIAGLSCAYADGIGSGARFNAPQGIAYDGAANLYISDSSNHAIRRLTVATGEVATLAGAAPPTATFGTTDATGSTARFNGPQGLHVDTAGGALYVTDYNNHTLRRVALADGAVTTVVGLAGTAAGTDGIGTAARLRNPIGVAADGAGNLYVAEDGNHDVRVVALANFAVTTNVGAAAVAGYADGVGTGALFFNPRGITLDGAGNYYIADHSNHAIRKVAIATGTVTTLAGLGAAFGSKDGVGAAATFNYPWGLAFDGTDTLYISDYNASTIRSITLSNGTVTTIAGTAGSTGNVDGTGAAARFTNPSGIALDSGSLYVADRSNHTIRKVVIATGVVTTIAGSPGNAGYQEGTGSAALFNQPIAVAIDTGKLYVADLVNRLVRVVPLAGGTTSVLAGAQNVNALADGIGAAARFSNITGIAAKDGKVYVADTNRIRMIDGATASVVTLSGPGGYSDGRGAFANFNFNAQPGLLSFDANGNLLLADFNNGLIRRFSPTTLLSSTVAGIFGSFGGIPGPMPTSITTSPRAAVAIPNGIAFAANYGVFTIR